MLSLYTRCHFMWRNVDSREWWLLEVILEEEKDGGFNLLASGERTSVIHPELFIPRAEFLVLTIVAKDILCATKAIENKMLFIGFLTYMISIGDFIYFWCCARFYFATCCHWYRLTEPWFVGVKKRSLHCRRRPSKLRSLGIGVSRKDPVQAERACFLHMKLFLLLVASVLQR